MFCPREKAYFSFDYQAFIFLLFFDFPGAKCGYFYTKKDYPKIRIVSKEIIIIKNQKSVPQCGQISLSNFYFIFDLVLK